MAIQGTCMDGLVAAGHDDDNYVAVRWRFFLLDNDKNNDMNVSIACRVGQGRVWMHVLVAKQTNHLRKASRQVEWDKWRRDDGCRISCSTSQVVYQHPLVFLLSYGTMGRRKEKRKEQNTVQVQYTRKTWMCMCVCGWCGVMDGWLFCLSDGLKWWIGWCLNVSVPPSCCPHSHLLLSQSTSSIPPFCSFYSSTPFLLLRLLSFLYSFPLFLSLVSILSLDNTDPQYYYHLIFITYSLTPHSPSLPLAHSHFKNTLAPSSTHPSSHLLFIPSFNP